MPQASRNFRIFVSSTFEDLKAERDALQKDVFPKLRELCSEHGCRFQAIDLRWGVSEEAGRDQRAMHICLDELKRCQDTSPRPNFIVLLGDRYGWQPPPPEIKAEEFERVKALVDDPEDQALLEFWYEKDENAVPGAFYLKPWPEDYDYEEDWKPLETRIHTALSKAASNIRMEVEEISRYIASATEQEILYGAMRGKDARSHVFCFFREIDDLPCVEAAKEFFDYDKQTGEKVPGTAQKVADLKVNLEEELPGNIHTYHAAWEGEGISLSHLDQLCADVYEELSRVILEEVQSLEAVDAMDKELADQEAFRVERSRFFTGRQSMLKTIADYLESNTPKPLAVWGEGGTGKSALAGQALEEAKKRHPGAEIVYRFIGATPPSTDGRSLLASLCRQITIAYGGDVSTIPPAWEDLTGDFPKRLALATQERPLILFLDSLDQLSSANNARSLSWLPGELPEQVRLVVTTRPGPELAALRNKKLDDYVVELEAMSREEGKELLGKWLEDAGRTLQPAQREEVLGKFAANGKPLYLKLAFEEARLWRSSTPLVKLDPQVEGIIHNLYGRLSNVANHGEVLTSHSLGYLAATREMNGLSEDEIMDVLSRDLDVYQWFFQSIRHVPPDMLDCVKKHQGTENASEADAWLQTLREDTPHLREFLAEVLPRMDGPRLPVVLWSRLYFDLEPYLAERSVEGATLLTFYHRELGEVALRGYLGDVDPEDRQKVTLREEGLARQRALAEYFNGIGDPEGAGYREEDRDRERWQGSSRALSELPYHVTMAQMWDELFSTLTDFQFLENKAQRANVSEFTGAHDEVEKVYGGVFELQEDYSRALAPGVFPAE